MTLPDEATPPLGPEDLLGPVAPAPAGDIVAPPDVHAMPEGGEVSSVGGMGRQILRVFIENKLAVVGLFVIVFFILFCFVGPLLYHTNQTNAELALTAYRGGGAVFAAGSIAWSGSLSHGGYSNSVSRITENVLRHFLRVPPGAPVVSPGGAVGRRLR